MFSLVESKLIEAPDVIDPSIETDLDDFLADPIGYGTYDWSDPISLNQFDSGRSAWFRHREILAR